MRMLRYLPWGDDSNTITPTSCPYTGRAYHDLKPTNQISIMTMGETLSSCINDFLEFPKLTIHDEHLQIICLNIRQVVVRVKDVH